jgi:hypothetical protein
LEKVGHIDSNLKPIIKCANEMIAVHGVYRRYRAVPRVAFDLEIVP